MERSGEERRGHEGDGDQIIEMSTANSIYHPPSTNENIEHKL
jgi:hypothetical protein